MIKKIKPAIPLLILLFVLQGVSGQDAKNISDHLRDKFTAYIKAVPREEIYIQTDREEYISGENIWFSTYLLERETFRLSKGSKIVYFELLNRENRPIIQKKIWLDGGVGPGQISLPDTLSTGVYTLRAYTNWMKNFLPYNCFIKDIRIYNSFNNKSLKEKTLPAKLNNDFAKTIFNREGLSMKVRKNETDGVDIIVNADEKYRADNGNLFYLFINTHGLINRVSPERVLDKTTIISIPRNVLSNGINEITLFNSKGIPVCESFCYSSEKENDFVTIHTSDSSGLRDKISIGMDFAKRKPTDGPTILSLSVTPETKRQSIMDFNDYMVFGTEFGLLPSLVIKGNKITSLPSEVLDSLLLRIKSNWINWNAILADEIPVFRYQMEIENSFLSGRLMSGNNKIPDANKYVLLSVPGKNAVFQYARTDEEGNFNFTLHIDEKLNDLIMQPEAATNNQMLSIESSFSDQYLQQGVSVDSTSAQPQYISNWSVNNQVTKIYGTSTSGSPLIPVIPKPLIKRFYGKPDNELLMKEYIALPIMQEVFFELLPGVPLKKKRIGYELSMNNPLNNLPYDVAPGMFIDGVIIQDAATIAALDPESVEKIEVVREKYFVGDYRFVGLVNIITKTADFSAASLPDYATRIAYRVVDPVSSFVSPDYSSDERKKIRIPDFRNTLYWNPIIKEDEGGHADVEFWSSDFVSVYSINIQGITSDGTPFNVKKSIRLNRKLQKPDSTNMLKF